MNVFATIAAVTAIASGDPQRDGVELLRPANGGRMSPVDRNWNAPVRLIVGRRP